MRAFYISAALLVTIFTLTMLNSYYLSNRSDQWLTWLNLADTAAGQEDWSAAGDHLRKIYNEWTQDQFYFHLVIRHNELDQVEALLLQTLAVCEEADAAEARLQLANLRSQLKVLTEMEALSISNIL